MEIDLARIREIFAAESAEHLAAMQDAALALESDSSNPKHLETIFRGAHTIKGNAASLEFADLARFAHGFEELLQRLRGREIAASRFTVDILLRAVDTLRELLRGTLEGHGELTAEQSALLAELSTGASTPPPNPLGPNSPSDGIVPTAISKPAAPSHSYREKTTTVRVPVATLDRMLDLSCEIAIAHGRLNDSLLRAGVSCRSSDEGHTRLQRIMFQLREEIMQLRMQPLGPVMRQCERAMRDIARAQDKHVRLELRGEEVEVDISVVEHLKDPLVHLIRNAVDHGIEPPERRAALGKDPCGRIAITATRDDNDIVIRMSDDGAGLDRQKILDRARAMIPGGDLQAMTDPELFALIFKPGFSTAARVTEVSGRGIGMDVVRQNVEAIGGKVTVESDPDRGTTMTLRLPLKLAIIEGLSVGVGDQTYIVPLHKVIECAPLPQSAQSGRSADGIINRRGEPLPTLRLRDWFSWPTSASRQEHVVVVEAGGRLAGILVDALYGPHQIVVKPLGRHLHQPPFFVGSTILGNGRVALIVDPAELLRAAAGRDGPRWSPQAAKPSADRQPDCGAVRCHGARSTPRGLS